VSETPIADELIERSKDDNKSRMIVGSEIRAAIGEVQSALTHANKRIEELELFEIIQHRCYDVRWFDERTGDDSQEYCLIFEHQYSEPKEREVGRGDTLKEALLSMAKEETQQEGGGEG